MMRHLQIKRDVVCLALSVLVGGCATVPSSEAEPVSEPPNRLAPRDLLPGECGLFVWSGDPGRNFILFSQAARFSGAWFTDQREVTLEIVEQSGEPANRQFPDIRFKSEDGDILELSLINRETITNGTRFKGGTLKVSGEDGWETVKPVVGLTACQPT